MKIYDGNVLSFGMFSQFKFEDHRFDTQFLGDFNEFIYYDFDLYKYPYLRGFRVYRPLVLDIPADEFLQGVLHL